MNIALICSKCGKVHTNDNNESTLIVDFKQKQMSFICMNKDCKHDNTFDFNDWQQKMKTSPLPRIGLM